MSTATDKAPDQADPPLTPEQQRQFTATGQLFHALASDPRYRKRVLTLIKEAAPDTPIPELDLEGTITKEVEGRLKPQAEESKKTQDRLDALERKLARDAWKQSHELTEEEAVEVEELAKTGQIGKAETAIEFYRAKQQLGTPRGTRKPPHGTAEYLEKLSKVSPRHTNKLKQLATDEAVRILSSTRRSA